MRGLFLFCAAVLCAGADGADTIGALIEQARGLPAEFGADAMIRLAGIPSLEKAKRIELLEQAFERAAGSQQPIKRRATPYRLDGPAGFLNRAHAQDLDVLSLRVRVVAALLPLDAGRARALFAKMPVLELQPASCDTFLVDDVSRFYEILGAAARQNDAGAKLIERYTAKVTSPAQVGPVAKLLAESGLADGEFRPLAARFAASLTAFPGDDRTFTQYRAAGRQVLELSQELQRRKMSPTPLLDAYRRYIVARLSGERCADRDLMQGTPQTFGLLTGAAVDREASNLVEFFNDSMRLPPVERIGLSEISPSKEEGAALGLRWCEDSLCREIADQIRGLTFSPELHPYLPQDKTKPEWHEKLRKLLAAIDAWQPEEGYEIRHYREKCGAYLDALGLVIEASDREIVLRRLLAFVERNPLQKENRMEWLLPVNGLIGRTALEPVALGRLAEELRSSRDPIIAFYARLEEAVARTAPEILPLL